MTKVGTKKNGHQFYYTITVSSKGKILYSGEVNLQIIKSVSRGKTMFSLVDENGITNRQFHKYINCQMKEFGKSDNSRRKAAHALSKFYSFLRLMRLNIFTLGQDEINKLKVFLKGEGKYECSNETVNSYLGILREFFICIGVRCDYLFSKHAVSRQAIEDKDFIMVSTLFSYDSNFPTSPHKFDRTPKYISFELYITLQKIAQEEEDMNGIILMHLMFRYGMRLGECLGLTEEDVIYTTINGRKILTLIIRNRLSDKLYQCAKRKITPRSKADYDSKSYIEQWRDDDYSHYYITESEDMAFEKAFLKFIEDTRVRMESLYPENYKKSRADIVHIQSFREKKLRENHYLFVNRLGKPLSSQLWGDNLKSYFFKAGISADKGKKCHNLSHRFRHGFAMMHAHFMDPPVPPHELQKMMHHRRLSSTMIYYNPTLEEECLYKTALQKKIFGENPELKAIMSSFLAPNTEGDEEKS